MTDTPTTQPDAPAELVTTTKTKDYLGVALINATPGVSSAKDSMGRATITGDKDYVGRGLVT